VTDGALNNPWVFDSVWDRVVGQTYNGSRNVACLSDNATYDSVWDVVGQTHTTVRETLHV